MLMQSLNGLALFAGLSLAGVAAVGTGTNPGSTCCGGAARANADEKPLQLELPKVAQKAGCKCCAGDAPKPEPLAKVDAKAIKLMVDDMTCAGCAKTVSKALTAVAGVDTATVDLKAKTVTVVPKADKTPSAKEMWEAVEKAGYKPTKLEGPSGKFEAKPTK